jgi:hypothetical protein
MQSFLLLLQVVHTVTTLPLPNFKLKFMRLEKHLLQVLEFLLNDRYLNNVIFVFILLFINYKLKVQQLQKSTFSYHLDGITEDYLFWAPEVMCNSTV